MFDQHQPIIGRWARSSPENFAQIQLLAILSARMPFERVLDDQRSVNSGNLGPLFGWKFEAWQQAKEQSAERLAKLEAIERMPWSDADKDTAMLVEVSRWYGLGFVKGGFVLQLTFGRVGCLDTRNEDTYGLKPYDVKAPWGLSEKSLRKRAGAYAALCERLGGCAQLWDAWCEGYVRGRLTDPWQVSAEHCRILGLDPGADLADIPFAMTA